MCVAVIPMSFLLLLLQVEEAQVSLTWLRGDTAGLLGLRGAASVAEA